LGKNNGLRDSIPRHFSYLRKGTKRAKSKDKGSQSYLEDLTRHCVDFKLVFPKGSLNVRTQTNC